MASSDHELSKVFELLETIHSDSSWDRVKEKALNLRRSNEDTNVLCRILFCVFDLNINEHDFLGFLDSCVNMQNLNLKIYELFLEKFSQSHAKPLYEILRDISNINDDIKKDFGEIKKIFSGFKKPITRDDIQRWSKDVRKLRPSKHEKIAVIWRAMEISSKHVLREIQILSVLMLYQPGQNRMAQIDTGEGKTIIIAMLAVLFCLDGLKVDIVTTSPELSVPQSLEMQSFYDLFNLSSSNIETGNKKDVYKCDVLYGSIEEFEGDVLRDEYLKEGTRAKRPYQIVIIDEADSMLIDGINNMTRLSSPMPGMSEMIPVLIRVWIELENCERDFKGDFDNSTLIISFVYNQLRVLIESRSEKVRVPEHLRDFVLKNHLHAWVVSAYAAKHTHVNGRDYIIRDGDIKIVDLFNTGVVYNNMTWGDGLHQFLQIKHNLYLASEDFATNYLGHPTFFKKYRSVYGLTGTIGCNFTKEFLKNAYQADSVILPSFKVKQHLELTPIVTTSRSEWLDMIVMSCLNKLHFNRAVMIISESINETEEIEKAFQMIKYPTEKILMYKTEQDSSIIGKKIESGQVIITTNICGRGVNIFLTDDVNNNGGLHICLTFLPENIRVQMQNIGRTSRSGQPGTNQIVLLNENKSPLWQIKAERDERYERKLQQSYADMEKIKTKADVFERFCHFLNTLDGSRLIPDYWNMRTLFTDGFQKEVLREVMKEMFSVWLKEQECDRTCNFEVSLTKYYEFEYLIIEKMRGKNILTNNPYSYIYSGNLHLLYQNYQEAIVQYGKAIDINGPFAVFAFINRSVAQNELYKKKETVSDLKVGCSFLDDIIKEHQVLYHDLNRLGYVHLANKFERKITLLQMTYESIQEVLRSTRNVAGTSSLLGATNGKKYRIVSTKWKESEDFIHHPLAVLISKDAIELYQSGWIGPIELQEVKPTGFKAYWEKLTK